MKTLPPCDHDGCPTTRCVQTANAKGVGISDWLEVAIVELLDEKRVQETKRNALEQSDTNYHWHDGVAFGIHAAIEHFRDAAKEATSNVADEPRAGSAHPPKPQSLE